MDKNHKNYEYPPDNEQSVYEDPEDSSDSSADIYSNDDSYHYTEHDEIPTKLSRKKKKALKKQQKKKKSKLKKFLLFLLFVVVIIVVYSVIEYNIGKRAAEADPNVITTVETGYNGSNTSIGSTDILFIGTDSRGDDRGRSDTIMLLHTSPTSKGLKLVSFMRDIYADIPGYGMSKLNAAYAYGGAELTRETLQNSFDVNAKYYAVANFETFEKVVDTLCPDGVEIDAEKDIDEMNITGGLQRMDGATLLNYARFRHDEEGDFGRVRRQQQAITAVAKQAFSLKSIFRIPRTMGSVSGYTDAKISLGAYFSVAFSFFTSGSTIDRLSVPVDGSWSYGSYEDAGSVLEVDDSTNQQAIKNFFNNK